MTEQNPAAEEQQTEHRRTIKSFVMRAGRMTEGQQRGLEQGWPKYGLELADGLRDFDEVFTQRRGPSRSASAWATRRWKWRRGAGAGFHRRGSA